MKRCGIVAVRQLMTIHAAHTDLRSCEVAYAFAYWYFSEDATLNAKEKLLPTRWAIWIEQDFVVPCFLSWIVGLTSAVLLAIAMIVTAEDNPK